MSYIRNGSTVVKVLEVIQTSECGEIRVCELSDESGHVFAFDIRRWYCTREDKTMQPTQKGVRIPIENRDDVVRVLQSIRC